MKYFYVLLFLYHFRAKNDPKIIKHLKIHLILISLFEFLFFSHFPEFPGLQYVRTAQLMRFSKCMDFLGANSRSPEPPAVNNWAAAIYSQFFSGFPSSFLRISGAPGGCQEGAGSVRGVSVLPDLLATWDRSGRCCWGGRCCRVLSDLSLRVGWVGLSEMSWQPAS